MILSQLMKNFSESTRFSWFAKFTFIHFSFCVVRCRVNSISIASPFLARIKLKHTNKVQNFFYIECAQLTNARRYVILYNIQHFVSTYSQWARWTNRDRVKPVCMNRKITKSSIELHCKRISITIVKIHKVSVVEKPTTSKFGQDLKTLYGFTMPSNVFVFKLLFAIEQNKNQTLSRIFQQWAQLNLECFNSRS